MADASIAMDWVTITTDTVVTVAVYAKAQEDALDVMEKEDTTIKKIPSSKEYKQPALKGQVFCILSTLHPSCYFHLFYFCIFIESS